MTRCSHGGCHDGRNVTRWYRIATSYSASRSVLMCADCARRDNGLTETWRPDLRVDPERPYKDQSHRRRVLPAWFGRLRGRDESGALA
jgi:hypothetical protein